MKLKPETIEKINFLVDKIQDKIDLGYATNLEWDTLEYFLTILEEDAKLGSLH